MFQKPPQTMYSPLEKDGIIYKSNFSPTQNTILMKKSALITLLLTATVLLSSACKWQVNKTIHGIEFKKVHFQLKENDTIGIYGMLMNNTTIDGF